MNLIRDFCYHEWAILRALAGLLFRSADPRRYHRRFIDRKEPAGGITDAELAVMVLVAIVLCLIGAGWLM